MKPFDLLQVYSLYFIPFVTVNYFYAYKSKLKVFCQFLPNKLGMDYFI